MKTTKEKESKEMKELIKAIENYHKKYKGDISFVGSFVAFDSKDNMIDDRLFMYGGKEVIKEQVKSLIEIFRKQKGDFINL